MRLDDSRQRCCGIVQVQLKSKRHHGLSDTMVCLAYARAQQGGGSGEGARKVRQPARLKNECLLKYRKKGGVPQGVCIMPSQQQTYMHTVPQKCRQGPQQEATLWHFFLKGLLVF